MLDIPYGAARLACLAVITFFHSGRRGNALSDMRNLVVERCEAVLELYDATFAAGGLQIASARSRLEVHAGRRLMCSLTASKSNRFVLTPPPFREIFPQTH